MDDPLEGVDLVVGPEDRRLRVPRGPGLDHPRTRHGREDEREVGLDPTLSHEGLLDRRDDPTPNRPLVRVPRDQGEVHHHVHRHIVGDTPFDCHDPHALVGERVVDGVHRLSDQVALAEGGPRRGRRGRRRGAEDLGEEPLLGSRWLFHLDRGQEVRAEARTDVRPVAAESPHDVTNAGLVAHPDRTRHQTGEACGD